MKALTFFRTLVAAEHGFRPSKVPEEMDMTLKVTTRMPQ